MLEDRLRSKWKRTFSFSFKESIIELEEFKLTEPVCELYYKTKMLWAKNISWLSLCMTKTSTKCSAKEVERIKRICNFILNCICWRKKHFLVFNSGPTEFMKGWRVFVCAKHSFSWPTILLLHSAIGISFWNKTLLVSQPKIESKLY